MRIGKKPQFAFPFSWSLVTVLKKKKKKKDLKPRLQDET